MSNEYYKPLDLDALFPKPVEESKKPGVDPAAVKAREEEIGIAVRTINEELQRVRTGTSKYVNTAQQFVENKTPFCINLSRLTPSSTPMDALAVVALARQDFGEKFATFVLDCFKPLYGDK